MDPNLQTLAPTPQPPAAPQDPAVSTDTQAVVVSTGRKYGPNTTYEQLTYIDQQIVDYQAMSGLLLDEGGEPKHIGAQQFALMLGYKDRQSLRDRQMAIPNFWDLANDRRRILAKGRLVSAVWKGVSLRAMNGDHKQAEMVLTHFGDYTPPAQKVEHHVSGLSDLLQMARQRMQQNQNQQRIGDGQQ